MKTLTLSDREATQLLSVLKYAYKHYIAKPNSLNEKTETVIIELIERIKQQI